MSLLDDFRADIGDLDTSGSGISPLPLTIPGACELIGDARVDIGDLTTSGSGFSPLVPFTPANCSLVGDFRVDLGDLNTEGSGVSPIPISSPSGCELLSDFRVDLGDVGPQALEQEPEAPEVWGCTFVTSSPYTIGLTDVFVFVNTLVPAPVIIYLPANPTCGQIFIIKDMKGDACINPITVIPAGGQDIDGFVAFRISQNKQSIMVTFNGTSWAIV